jgi:hypothetical protein
VGSVGLVDGVADVGLVSVVGLVDGVGGMGSVGAMRAVGGVGSVGGVGGVGSMGRIVVRMSGGNNISCIAKRGRLRMRYVLVMCRAGHASHCVNSAYCHSQRQKRLL